MLEVCLTCETPIGDDVPAGQIFLQANLERDERERGRADEQPHRQQRGPQL